MRHSQRFFIFPTFYRISHILTPKCPGRFLLFLSLSLSFLLLLQNGRNGNPVQFLLLSCKISNWRIGVDGSRIVTTRNDYKLILDIALFCTNQVSDHRWKKKSESKPSLYICYVADFKWFDSLRTHSLIPKQMRKS